MRRAYLGTLAASSPRAISRVFFMPTLPSWHTYSNIGPGVRGIDMEPYLMFLAHQGDGGDRIDGGGGCGADGGDHHRRDTAGGLVDFDGPI